MIKVAVSGAHGRMGREIVHIVQNDPQTKLCKTLTRENVKLNENMSTDMNTPIDVMIDFSVQEALIEHLALCEKRLIPMVIGITGLPEDVKLAMEKAAKHIPIVYAPNMSIGVTVSLKLLENLTKTLQENHIPNDIAIQETHHKHKKDKPSGTALCMSEVISKAIGAVASNQEVSTVVNKQEVGKAVNKTVNKAVNKIVDKPDHSTIPIASLRVGEALGLHTVIFSLPGEQLEITHKAEDRNIFARGAVLAAKWILGKPKGLYDMQDVLGLRGNSKAK